AYFESRADDPDAVSPGGLGAAVFGGPKARRPGPVNSGIGQSSKGVPGEDLSLPGMPLLRRVVGSGELLPAGPARVRVKEREPEPAFSGLTGGPEEVPARERGVTVN